MLIRLQFCRSQSKVSYWTGIKVSADSSGKPFPCLCQLLETACTPWLMTPASIFQARDRVTPPSAVVTSPTDFSASLLQGPL